MNNLDLNGARVMVTGGTSMIGSNICNELERLGAIVDNVPHKSCDLTSIHSVVWRFSKFLPDYVIHAAGYNGGIEWNRKYPADIYYKTVMMALNVLNTSKEFKVKKIVSILASCSYPDLLEDIAEEKLWSGKSNDSVECHGLAKRTLDAYSRQLYKQHGLNAISVVLTNSYGPKDSFHPEKTKVVGAMIKRFVDAVQNDAPYVECWGTGRALRELLFCRDAGKLIVSALVNYNEPLSPLNIGNPTEISIKKLAETVAQLTEYRGEIRWLTEKGDGQLRKKLDLTRMNKYLPAIEYTSLEDGLKETIEWYQTNAKCLY